MGLDMYMYKASKPQLKGQKWTYEGLEQAGYSMFPVKDEITRDMKDLRKFMVKITVPTEYYDVQKIKETFNLRNTPYWSGFGPDGWYFSTSHRDDPSVTIPDDQIKDYLVTRDGTFWVVKLDEVGYWRKEYDLQDMIHALKRVPIANCGYYCLTSTQLKKIDAFIRANDIEPFECSAEDAGYIYYHEWY